MPPCASRFVLAVTITAASLGCDRPASPQPAPPPAPPPQAAAEPSLDKLPSTLGIVIAPTDNPPTPEKIALGHQLFFDKRLSVDGSRSCYSCHLNEDGNGGHDPLAVGAAGKQLTRHSPVIWNVGFLAAQYWDGRAATLEAQATAAWAGGNMGVGKDNLAAKAKELEAIPAYKAAFDAAFPGKGVTPETVAQALASYERSLQCDATAYDRFARGDKAALDEAQQRGAKLFLGKAACVACHTPPFFSTAYGKEATYFNVGIGTKDKAEADVDVGRMSVTKQDADWAAFKVPSLRNVSKSAPYFHDGSVASLTEAVRYMASGGHKNKNLSPLMVDRQLTDDEVKDIVAFLGALDCGKGLVEPLLP